MSHIFCVIDGMTDPQFEIAEYPALAGMKLASYVDTCQGNEPESLGCILRLLGTRQVPQHLRGYAEALGAGIPVGEQDLVLRGSWFALDEAGCCTVPLSAPQEMRTSADCRYYPLGEYKSLLVFPGLSSQIDRIVTHPPYECVGLCAKSLCPQGSEALRTVFWEWMGTERCLLPWGQSVCTKLAPFPEPAAVVCGTTVVKGIARLLGMHLVDLPQASGDTDTELHAKLQSALCQAEQYPFVLLHINGADEAAHRKDAQEKNTFLHRVEHEVLRPLLTSGHRITVVSDHGTDPESGKHLASVQPVFVSDGCIRQNPETTYKQTHRMKVTP